MAAAAGSTAVAAADVAAQAGCIDCPCCGRRLLLPDGLREGAAFACATCGTLLRNVAFVRSFRWDTVDPYMRKHGMTRGGFWGGTIGSLIWLPVTAGLMLVRGRFSAGSLALLAVPYLLVLVILRHTRPGRPPLLWMMHVWIGLGAYCLYLAAVNVVMKDWTDVLKTVADISPALLFMLGAAWVVTGVAGSWLYRARARRAPQAQEVVAP